MNERIDMIPLRRGLALTILALAVTLALSTRQAAAQVGTVIPMPVMQFVDSAGIPLAGGTLTTYAAGTTTTLLTCADSNVVAGACVTPNSPIVTLDGSGRAAIYLLPATYKFLLKNSSGATVWTQDNIAAYAPWNLNTLTGKVVYLAPTTLILASNAVTPTQNVHTLDTSGGAQNLNTINTTNVTSGFVLYVTGNNPGANPVTIKNGTGNITLTGGDFVMSAAASWMTLILKGSTWFELGRSPAAGGASSTPDVRPCEGRLTLTTAVPVTTADVLAATTVYWTPYIGTTCYLFDGASTWTAVTFAEISIAVPATTSTVYDLFVYNNAGTMTLEATAWSTLTTRATALVMQNAIRVKSGATTRRYVGTFQTTTVSGQTEDSVTHRYVWNYDNRVNRVMQVYEGAATWTYGTASWRQTNANAANQLMYVMGLDEEPVEFTVGVAASNPAAGILLGSSIGFDNTANPDNFSQNPTFYSQVAATNIATFSVLRKYGGIGQHIAYWIEFSGTGTTTFVGTAGHAGLIGVIRG